MPLAADMSAMLAGVCQRKVTPNDGAESGVVLEGLNQGIEPEPYEAFWSAKKVVE